MGFIAGNANQYNDQSTKELFLKLKNRLKEPGCFSLQKGNGKRKLRKSENTVEAGVNIKMREELFQLQDVMVYGHIDFSCNNSVEMKSAFRPPQMELLKWNLKRVA